MSIQSVGGMLTDGDVVVVVDGNEVTKLQVTSSAGSFACNTLHSTSVSEEDECVVVDQFKVWLVEDSAGVSLRHGETDCVGKPLTERSCGDFDAWSIVGFRVTRCDAVNCLTKC